MDFEHQSLLLLKFQDSGLVLSNQRNPTSPDKPLSGEDQKPGDLGSDQL